MNIDKALDAFFGERLRQYASGDVDLAHQVPFEDQPSSNHFVRDVKVMFLGHPDRVRVTMQNKKPWTGDSNYFIRVAIDWISHYFPNVEKVETLPAGAAVSETIMYSDKLLKQYVNQVHVVMTVGNDAMGHTHMQGQVIADDIDVVVQRLLQLVRPQGYLMLVGSFSRQNTETIERKYHGMHVIKHPTLAVTMFVIQKPEKPVPFDLHTNTAKLHALMSKLGLKK